MIHACVIVPSILLIKARTRLWAKKPPKCYSAYHLLHSLTLNN